MDTQRRDLMTKRDAALAAGDLPTFHALTRQLADLPLKGVPELTKRDKDRYQKRRAS